ncbi:MAG: UvrD-helicase domain-containing protein [Candidatus Cloacimonetes bacterium]|nr:UvrD-helicase domain-containing protein [Candidatus Cloacimonadota bacterium]
MKESWKDTDQSQKLGINMNFLDDLNPPQKQVATTTEGPILVLAGAGSGKTRSIIYRTAYLINVKHINPSNILAVTFTNKAARELKNRLQRSFNISTYSLWIGTFHSVCTRILRAEQDSLPFTSDFSIFDDVDQKSIFKKIYKKLDIDAKDFPVRRVSTVISNQKNSLVLPKDFFNFNEENYFTETTYKIYKEYQNFLLENNALDFDDLLMYTAILLHDNKEIRKKYVDKFRYVMIDEYQDTNYAQFKIINLIAKEHQNLCVVGDDDQAIYSWRGANISNILNFEKDYKNVLTVKLEQNYRSPKSILDTANCLIKNNSERHPKELWTNITSKDKPKLLKLENEKQEAEFVAEMVSQLSSSGTSLNDCLILYRTNAQSRVFENAFYQHKLKYQIVGGVNFYQRKEIKDIVAYLRILTNPHDSNSFLRILNFPPRKIGKVSTERIERFAFDNDFNLFEAVQHEISSLNGKTAQTVLNFGARLKKWKKLSLEIPITPLVKKIINELELINIYDKSDDPKDIARAENLKEFVTATKEFSDNFEYDTEKAPMLTDFLQSISLQTDMDNLDEDIETIKLMTMHNAKGLEFDHVFIVGVEDGLLPHSRSIDDIQKMEEERRLLYVAITRAKKSIHLTYVRMRPVFGSISMAIPSRFLLEIDDDLIDSENNRYYDLMAPRPKRRDNTNKPIVTESQKYFKIGQNIYHNKFGKGVVLNVDGTGKEAKLSISFSGGQLKKIIGTFVTTEEK